MRALLVVVGLLAARTPADACDRAASPLELPSVGLTSADVVVADVTQVANRVATLSIVSVLKGSAAASKVIDVRGVVDEARPERCSATPVANSKLVTGAITVPLAP